MSTIVAAETVFVGLDYHQQTVQVCLLDRAGKMLMNRACRNDVPAIIQAVQARRPQASVQAALESCCGAADLAERLIQSGWLVNLAHPGFVSRMKQNPDKTDYSDARMLAELERVGFLPKVWLASQEVRQLRRVVRYRQQLVAQRRNIKLRIGGLLREERIERPVYRPWTKAWLKWLAEQAPLSEQGRWVLERHLATLSQLIPEIQEVEQHLSALTAGDPLVQRLLKQAGLGLVTAVTLRAEIGRFDRFRSGKQLARFCGLSPRNASSGARQADAGLIRAGQPALRSTLMEAAHQLVRHDLRWTRLFHQLRAGGKPYSLAVAAVANRFMRWLYHQLQPAALIA